ncbi:MAG TPA: hypothetical protein VM347_09360 [Nonomuraea sp.]|nr:hypothetical protein [Nonomuraea sp.]
MRYADDATAIAETKALLAAELQTLRGRTSMLVGRRNEAGEVRWLGAWHLDDALTWMPAE